MPLQRCGAKEPARSRRLTPRRPQRSESCAGPRYEIFTLGSEDRNGGRGLTAVDVRTVSGAWRTPRPAPSPLTMCPSSPQAIRAAEARADQAGGGACPKRQAEEELSYAAQAIDKTAGSMRLAEIEEGPLWLLSQRAAAAGPVALRRPGSASLGACHRAGARCSRLASCESGWVGLRPAAGFWDRWAVRFRLVLVLVRGSFGVSRWPVCESGSGSRRRECRRVNIKYTHDSDPQLAQTDNVAARRPTMTRRTASQCH